MALSCFSYIYFFIVPLQVERCDIIQQYLTASSFFPQYTHIMDVVHLFLNDTHSLRYRFHFTIAHISFSCNNKSENERMKPMKQFLHDFKAFAMRGNVLDMAVGVVVGGAFSKIVTSLVSDIITPLIGLLVGSTNFENLKLVLHENANTKEVLTLNYGSFLQNIIDFIIIAFCIFCAIKIIGKFFNRKKEETVKEERKASNEEILLMEIRDLLKEQKGQ